MFCFALCWEDPSTVNHPDPQANQTKRQSSLKTPKKDNKQRKTYDCARGEEKQIRVRGIGRVEK